MVYTSRYPDSIPPPKYQDNLGKFYWQKLQDFKERTLFVDQTTGREWRGEEIKSSAERVARALVEKLKLEPGSCCYFYASNSDLLQVAALGAILAGCSVCVGAPGEPKTEVAYMTDQVEPGVIFVASDHCKAVVEMILLKMIPSETIVCLMDDEVPKELAEHKINYVLLKRDMMSYESPVASRTPIPRHVDPDTPAYILFTSGSTGRPKAVARTHKNSIYVAHSFATTNGELWPVDKDSVVAGHLQLDHGTGTFSIKMCLALGFKLVIMDGYQFERMAKAIDDHGITDIMLGSALLHQFITRPTRDLDLIEKLSQVRSLITIGSPMASHKAALSFMDRYPNVSIRQAFGMTECGFISLVRHAECRADSSSVGYLLPNLQVKLLNRDKPDESEITAPDEKGELYVRGPTVSPGYMGSQFSAASAKCFMADGFYRSNDVASVSADKRLYIHGRFSDVLCLYDGWKVLPQEIEKALVEHEGIKEAGVIGIPHPDLPTCHAPRAYIVPTEQWRRKLRASDVHAFAKLHLSEYKQLHGGIVILDEPLPRGSLQKLDRKRLYMRYKTEAQTAA